MIDMFGDQIIYIFTLSGPVSLKNTNILLS